MAETFESDRLVYRAIEDSDDDFFYQLVQDSEAWQQFNPDMPLPGSRRLATEFRKYKAENSLLGVIICMKTPNDELVPIGFLDVRKGSMSDHHKEVELGIIIQSTYRGCGYGGEAILWSLKWTFHTAGLHRMQATCGAFNTGARRLYARLGFKEEGIRKENWWYQGKWWDRHVFAVLDHEWQGLQQAAEVLTPGIPLPKAIQPVTDNLPSGLDTVNFRSQRLLYRAVEADKDEAFFYQLGQDSTAWQRFDRMLPKPRTKEDASEGIRFAHNNLFAAIICLPPSAESLEPTPIGLIKMGHVDPHTHHNRGWMGIIMHPSFRGRGYGTEAIFWGLKWAFVTAGFHRITMSCCSYNEGAVRLYTKLGLKQEAVFREWIWYQGKWWDKIDFGVLETEWRELVKGKVVA